MGSVGRFTLRVIWGSFGNPCFGDPLGSFKETLVVRVPRHSKILGILVYCISVRPDQEFWTEPDRDRIGVNLAGTGPDRTLPPQKLGRIRPD